MTTDTLAAVIQEAERFLAAALEALADQVVPNPATPHDSCCDVLQAHLRFQILAIAAELRGGET